MYKLFKQFCVLVDRKKFSINFNLEKLLPLTTATGIVTNKLNTTIAEKEKYK